MDLYIFEVYTQIGVVDTNVINEYGCQWRIYVGE